MRRHYLNAKMYTDNKELKNENEKERATRNSKRLCHSWPVTGDPCGVWLVVFE